jgi:oligopeptide transport system substrate-binding protein
MAVDKRGLSENVRRTGEPPARALIPPGAIGGYTSPKGVDFDPEGARKLLAEAGYPDPSKFMTVEILFNKDGGHDKIAQAVAKNWQEYLGVSVQLSQKEITIIRDDLKNANYMVSRGSWYGDYGDPTTFLDLSRTGDGNNDRKYSSPKYDALMDAAAAERDPAKRLAILSEAERMLVEDELPVLPLFHYAQIYLFDPDKLSGLSSHPRQEQNLYLVDMLGDGKGAERAVCMPPRAPGVGAGAAAGAVGR